MLRSAQHTHLEGNHRKPLRQRGVALRGDARVELGSELVEVPEHEHNKQSSSKYVVEIMFFSGSLQHDSVAMLRLAWPCSAISIAADEASFCTKTNP